MLRVLENLERFSCVKALSKISSTQRSYLESLSKRMATSLKL